mmetsp:Transcript_24251/g.50699  ORF Transcript_24251/g.50699 Transcript_24251/m.50699 type:complete len:103 (-) Transcript_24251:465-773(-)
MYSAKGAKGSASQTSSNHEGSALNSTAISHITTFSLRETAGAGGQQALALQAQGPVLLQRSEFEVSEASAFFQLQSEMLASEQLAPQQSGLVQFSNIFPLES